jgi:hypothetical protein
MLSVGLQEDNQECHHMTEKQKMICLKLLGNNITMQVMLWEAETMIVELLKKCKEKDAIIKDLREIIEYNEKEISELHEELNKSQDADYMYELQDKVVRLTKLTKSLLKAQRDFVYSYRF